MENGVQKCWSIGGRSLEEVVGTLPTPQEAGDVRNYARNLPGFIASFHVLSDIIEQIRPVITRFLAYYRSELFFNREGNDSSIRKP